MIIKDLLRLETMQMQIKQEFRCILGKFLLGAFKVISLFVYNLHKKIILILIIYISDVLVDDKKIEILMNNKDELQKCYKIIKLSESSYFFYIDFFKNKNNGTINLSQTKYIYWKLEEFRINDTKIAAISMIQGHFTKHKNEKSLDVKRIKLYKKSLNLLLYLTNTTRHNITFVC